MGAGLFVFRALNIGRAHMTLRRRHRELGHTLMPRQSSCKCCLLSNCRVGMEYALPLNPGADMSGIWWYLRGWKSTLWNFIVPMFLLNTQQGSATIVHAATAPEFTGPAYFTPYKQKSWCPYYTDLLGMFNGATAGRPDPRAYKEEYWQKLWDFSEQQIQPFL